MLLPFIGLGLFPPGEPLQRNAQDLCEYSQLVIGDEAVTGFDFTDGLAFDGDTIDLHTGGEVCLGQSHSCSCLMDTVAGNILFPIEIVDLQGVTSYSP